MTAVGTEDVEIRRRQTGQKGSREEKRKEVGWRTRATVDASPAPCPAPTPGSTRRTDGSHLPQCSPSSSLPVVTYNLQRLAASRDAAINGRTPSECSDARKCRSKGSVAVSSGKEAEFEHGAGSVRSKRDASTLCQQMAAILVGSRSTWWQAPDSSSKSLLLVCSNFV